METYRLKGRILLPVALATLALFAAFVMTLYQLQEGRLTNEVRDKLESAKSLFSGLLQSDASIMGAALHAILNDEQIRADFKAKDKTALLSRSKALFEQFRTAHDITHFYYTGPDRINILRVHKPEKYGDKIDRFTTLQAEKTGVTSEGIELGPLGTFTLRVVQPWYDGPELLGFVELGEEIEHITRKLRAFLNVEVFVVIYKTFIDRESWEQGMKMLGREAEWDRFSSLVLIGQTLAELPETLARHFAGAHQHPKSPALELDASLDDRHYKARTVALIDASGQAVGEMFVMSDVTRLKEQLYPTIGLTGMICLIIGFSLLFLYYRFVGKVEEDITRTNQQLTQISKAVESSSDAVIMVDLSGNVTYQNTAFLELFGWTVGQLNAAGFQLTLYDNPSLAREIFVSIVGGEAWQGEAWLRSRKGRTIPVFLRADCIKSEIGTIVGLVYIHTDITARKQAEEALRESEKRFQHIVDFSPFPISVMEPDGQYVYLNRKFHEIFGYTLEDIPTGKHWFLKAYPDEEYRRSAVANWQSDLQTFRGPESTSREFQVTCKDGTVCDIIFRPVLMDKGTLFIIYEDLTEFKRTSRELELHRDHLAELVAERTIRLTKINEQLRQEIVERQRAEEALKQSEQRYRSVVFNIPGAVYRCDKDRVIDYVSHGIKEITGYPPADFIQNNVRSFESILLKEDLKMVEDVASSCLRRKVPIEVEYRIMCEDGGVRWVQDKGRGEFDEKGELVWIDGVLLDITKRKRAEEDLRKSREQLRELSVHLQAAREQERTIIARELHDDLGQTLTALKMELSWLEKKLPKNQETLIRKTRSIEDIIDTTIQSVKRIYSGLRPFLLDDLGLVAAIEWMAKGFEDHTGIPCDLKCSGEKIFAKDLTTATFRIFQEALTNVGRHANATRVEVSLEEKEGELILKVIDNGKGIEEEQISNPKSFGLIGIQERARALGGHVKISGIPGKGTEVHVRIPRREES